MNSPLFIGILSALFFSSTFITNRMLGQTAGHWFWTASLRYAHTIVFIIAWLLVTGHFAKLRHLATLYINHWKFWTIAGTVGFGIFYTGICLSAAYAPGWVIATTWQATILATPLVLHLFAKTPPMKSIALVLFTFMGVLLVNAEQFRMGTMHQLLWGSIPVLIAALASPIGNQMVWEATHAGFKKIPFISDPVLKSPLHKLFLMSVGTIPYWIIIGLFIRPAAPSSLQVQSTALVALLSGIVATGLFFLARQKCHTSKELTAVDSTQASEVIFTVLGEKCLLGGLWPSLMGWLGILMAMAGQLAALKTDKTKGANP